MMKTRWSLRASMVALALLALLPVTATGERPSAAMRYESCMDHAEGQLETCLEAASELTEVLCWSRFGYDKLGCSVRYAIESVREA
jgi:hypothetical protein